MHYMTVNNYHSFTDLCCPPSPLDYFIELATCDPAGNHQEECCATVASLVVLWWHVDGIVRSKKKDEENSGCSV